MSKGFIISLSGIAIGIGVGIYMLIPKLTEEPKEDMEVKGIEVEYSEEETEEVTLEFANNSSNGEFGFAPIKHIDVGDIKVDFEVEPKSGVRKTEASAESITEAVFQESSESESSAVEESSTVESSAVEESSTVESSAVEESSEATEEPSGSVYTGIFDVRDIVKDTLEYTNYGSIPELQAAMQVPVQPINSDTGFTLVGASLVGQIGYLSFMNPAGQRMLVLTIPDFKSYTYTPGSKTITTEIKGRIICLTSDVVNGSQCCCAYWIEGTSGYAILGYDMQLDEFTNVITVSIN